MKLPKQTQAILRESTPLAAAPRAVRAADADPACVARCSQLDPTAKAICIASCG
jgi:hypothetical protein